MISGARKIALLRDFAKEAEVLRAGYGKTTLFSTGATGLDSYLGGGFGREGAYEIVLLFGPPKIGKSFISLNFLKHAVMSQKRIGIMALEDDGPDVFLRFTEILGVEATRKYILSSDLVHIIPPETTEKLWKLDELLGMIEIWFTEKKIDLILLDHLQFAFENAESIKGENEYISQRIFMRHLNNLMRRIGKTIILVSHVNKNSQSRGMNKIVGSSGIAGAATKILEISKEGRQMYIQEHGSRFTPTPPYPYAIAINGSTLEDVHVQQAVSF